LAAVLLELGRLTVPPHELNGVFAESDLRQSLREKAREQELLNPLGAVLDRAQILHGDLNRGNILLDSQNGRQLTLVDFEHARIGPSVLNWYDFILRNLLIALDRLPINAGTVIRRLERLPGNRRAERWLDRLTIEYLEGCLVSRDLHQPLLIVYLSHLCSDRIINEPDRVLNALKHQDLNLKP
jgi:hypothetical protein